MATGRTNARTSVLVAEFSQSVEFVERLDISTSERAPFTTWQSSCLPYSDHELADGIDFQR